MDQPVIVPARAGDEMVCSENIRFIIFICLCCIVSTFPLLWPSVMVADIVLFISYIVTIPCAGPALAWLHCPTQMEIKIFYLHCWLGWGGQSATKQQKYNFLSYLVSIIVKNVHPTQYLYYNFSQLYQIIKDGDASGSSISKEGIIRISRYWSLT